MSENNPFDGLPEDLKSALETLQNAGANVKITDVQVVEHPQEDHAKKVQEAMERAGLSDDRVCTTMSAIAFMLSAVGGEPFGIAAHLAEDHDNLAAAQWCMATIRLMDELNAMIVNAQNDCGEDFGLLNNSLEAVNGRKQVAEKIQDMLDRLTQAASVH